jgi:hypothetical protein
MGGQGGGEAVSDIFIVFGEAGECSDHPLWRVRAYQTRDAAEAEVARLNALSKAASAAWAALEPRYRTRVACGEVETWPDAPRALYEADKHGALESHCFAPHYSVDTCPLVLEAACK